MVQHNDKWKKKATREYHKKHGTFPVGRGRGRGRGANVEDEPPQEVSEENVEGNEDGGDDSNAESGNESNKEEQESRRERSKYSRRKIQSNSWRFESEEPDPYLGNHPLALSLIKSLTKPPWSHQNQITHISPHDHSKQKSNLTTQRNPP